MKSNASTIHEKVRKMWLRGATKLVINDYLKSLGIGKKNHRELGAFHNVHRKFRFEKYGETFGLLHKSTAKKPKVIKYENRWDDRNCPMKRQLEDILLDKVNQKGIRNAFILASTNAKGQFDKYTANGFKSIVGAERNPNIYKKYSKVSPFPYLRGDYSELAKHFDNSYYFAADYCAMCLTEGETIFQNIPKGSYWSYTLGDYNRQVNGETRMDRLKIVAKYLGGKLKDVKEINVHGGEYLEHGAFTVRGKKFKFHCYKEKGKAKPMMVVTNF